MKQQFWVVSILSTALGVASGCQKEKPPEPAPAPPPAAVPAPVAQTKPAPPPEPPKPAPKALEWDDPPQWKKVPASGMRAASYQIPAAKGDKEGGDLNVFVLGGDVDANIQRWVDEFSNFDLKTLVRSSRKVNDMQQTIVEIPDGHFSGGMGETKESDHYGLLGAIVVAPSGAEFFFKLTAPSKAVKAARKPFYKLLDSVHVEKPAAPAASAKPAEPAPAAPPAPASAGAAGAAPHP